MKPHQLTTTLSPFIFPRRLRIHSTRPLLQTKTLQLSRPYSQKKKRAPIDESSWANAQHKPSLGNASFGHLVSELSSTKEGMEHLRVEGRTMSEEHRAQARGVVKWLIRAGAVVVGVPVGLGLRRMIWDGEEGDRVKGVKADVWR
jgi:hypothetical protein